MNDSNYNLKTINQYNIDDTKKMNDTNLTDNPSEEGINNTNTELNKHMFSINDSYNITKKKINRLITLDTIVYEILGPGESKIKDYNKISSEIKNVELMAKKEKAKLQKKISQMNKKLNNNKNVNEIKQNEKEKDYIGDNVQNKIINLQVKKLLIMEYERDKKYNFIEVIQKLKIPPEKRTIRDILRIKTYFDQAKLGLSFKEEFTNINIAEKLIYFCCIEMRYKRFEKGKTIIKIGEPPDNFYTIIFGKANILKPMPKVQYLTGFQYFKYLMNMRKQKENYIFNLCIKNNRHNYYIEPNIGEIIHYIFLLIYLEQIRSIADPTIDFDKVLDLLDITPEELGIDPNLVTSNYYINDNLKKIVKKIPHISSDIIEKYSFVNDYLTKKEVTIYEYKKFLSLETNDYFGDSAIETNSPRNATIIAEEDTDIAYLSNKLYFMQIASEKAIILQNKIFNLHHSSFFQKIKIHKFSKKYYGLFISEKYSKGDIIFNERENIRYLYFIEEGSIELSINKSMNEIESLLNLIEEKKQFLMKNNYDEIIFNSNLKSGEYQNKNVYNYSQITSSIDDIVNYLNEKQNNKLIILNSKEDIGIVSYFLGSNYLSTGKVISKNAKIYKIDIDYLDQMLESEIEMKCDFYKRLKDKLELLSKILFTINNIKLIMTDEKITQNKINQKNIEENEAISINNINNKTLIDYEKINSLLNEQKDNNSSTNINNNNTNNINNNETIKPKNEILKLPILNIKNKNKNNFNISFRSLNVKEGSSERQRAIKINRSIKKGLKFNNLKILNDINPNQKIISPKKALHEDNIISKIQKEIISFSQDKYTFSRQKINIKINKENFKTLDSSHKSNEKIYLTELLNVNNPNTKETENNNINNIREYKYSSSKHLIKKLTQSPEKSINLESSRELNNIRYNSHFKTLFNDYNRFHTEGNIVINNNNNESIKDGVYTSHKKISHPYYDPLTLIKKERYKIFENKNVNNNNLKSDDLYSHIERVKELKKIRSSLKNNFRFKFKLYNKNY